MHYGAYPSQLDIRIGKLKPGDEIIILQGEGYLPVSEETVAIVWKVDHYSAICADGTAISGNCISDFIVTGRHLEDYGISNAARLIQYQNKPDWTVPDPFSSEPE